jgi:type I restriction enzyme, S subunit
MRLDQCCDIVAGATPSTNDPSLWGGDIFWVTPKDLSNLFGSYISDTPRKLTQAGLKSCAATVLPINSVLFSSRAPIGHVAINTVPMATNQGFKSFIPKAGLMHAQFLFQWLRFKRAYLESLGNGATFKEVSKSIVSRIEISLPPLPEQRRIAAILDQAETLRTQRRTALALLDTLTQSIFLDMFGDDAQGEPKFPVAALVDVLETPLQNGAYYPKEQYTVEGGVEMVHMSDAFNSIVSRGTLKRVSCSDADLKKYSLSESDILLARRSLTYEGAAKPCLIPPATEPLLFESSFIRVTPAKTKLLVQYLFHYLGNETIRDKRVRPFVTQSTISGINQSNLERVSIVVPPLPLQKTFATRIQAIEALKSTHRAALAQLDALFASLQHRAFSGELTRPAASAAQALPTQPRSFNDLLQLDPEKGLEALIYVCKRTAGSDFYKSHKTLYFADRHHLGHHGRLIYGETYNALPMGPVPQAAYDAAKLLIGEAMFSPFDDAVLRAALRRSDKQLIALRDADFSKLSAAERASLDYAIRYCADMSFAEVKAASHDSVYDKTPKNTAIAMQDLIASLPQIAQQRFFGGHT